MNYANTEEIARSIHVTVKTVGDVLKLLSSFPMGNEHFANSLKKLSKLFGAPLTQGSHTYCPQAIHTARKRILCDLQFKKFFSNK